MTAAESYQRLTVLVAREDLDVQVILGSKNEEGDAYDHQKVDMGNHVASHFLGGARKAVADRDLALPAAHFQPGDHPGDARLVYLEPEEVPGVDAVIESIEPPQNCPWFTGAVDFGKRLRYYVVRVQHGNRKAYFFRRASQKQEIVKKGLLVRLSGHRFAEVEDRLFLFDDRIDFILFEGYTFLNTFDPFMKLFADDIKIAFAEAAAPAFVALRELLVVENVDEFEAVFRDDARLSGALIRVHERGGLANLTMEWIVLKNDLLHGHKLTVLTKPDGSRSIQFESMPTKRFILMKILEEKVNRGDLTGTTWVAGSHVPG